MRWLTTRLAPARKGAGQPVPFLLGGNVMDVIVMAIVWLCLEIAFWRIPTQQCPVCNRFYKLRSKYIPPESGTCSLGCYGSEFTTTL